MLYCNEEAYKGASVYFPHKSKISPAYYYTQDVIRCRCKSVQKSVNFKNAGIVPPPYEVSSAYTEPLDALYTDYKYYTGKGDFKENRVLKNTFPKYNLRRRQMKPIFRESLSQKHRNTKSSESISYPSETSKKSSNKIFKRKTIVEYDRGSKKYNYNTRKGDKRDKPNHYLDEVDSKDIFITKPRKISLTILNRKCKRNDCLVTSPVNGKFEKPRNKRLKTNRMMNFESQNQSTNEEINRPTSNFTKKLNKPIRKKSINSPSLICKCVDERPNIRFEIKPKSIRDKDETIQQVLQPCKKSWCRNAFRTSKSFDCSCDMNNIIKHSNKKNVEGAGDVPEWARNKFSKVACTCDELSSTEQSKMLKTTINTNETHDHGLSTITPKQANHTICKSDGRNLKTEPTASRDTTCNIPTISTTTVRIKDKIICLCHKYSQRLRAKERKFINEKYKIQDNRERGPCKDTLVKKQRITCKCGKSPSVNQFIDQTGNLSRGVSKYLNQRQYSSQTTQLRTIKTEENEQKPRATYEKGINKDSGFKCFCRCLKSRFTIKNKSPINMAPQKLLSHENDQTGEPFFEIKVDPNNMCVLNSDEIKDRVSALGTLKKVKSCICPSHDMEKQRFLQKVACSAGLCENAYKTKNTDFKCKCLSSKTRTCSDVTCGVNFNAKSLPVQNKPYLEVRLDSDNLCILNSEDIQKKINLIGVACATGICTDAAKDNTRYICKCTQRKTTEIDECSDRTCRPLVKFKNRNERNKRMRSKLDTSQLNSIKSKLSFICACIMSPENGTKKIKNRNQTISQTPPDVFNEKQRMERYVKEKCHAFGDYRIDGTDGQEPAKKNRKRQKQIPNNDDLVSTKLTECAICQCNKTKSLWCKSLFSCKRHKYVINRTSTRRKNVHKRNGLSLPSIIKKREVKDHHCSCCICGENRSNCSCKHLSKTEKYTSSQMVCDSCLALIKKDRKHVNKLKQEDLSVPLSSFKEREEPRSGNKIQEGKFNKQRNINKCLCFEIDKNDLKNGKNRFILKQNNPESSHSLKKRNENVCLCYHICKCGVEKGKKKTLKQKSNKKKIIENKEHKRKHQKQLKREEKRGVHKRKTNQRIARKKRKAFLNDEKKIQRQKKKKEKIERKKKEKLFQIEKKQLEAISKGKEEAEETSCLADFFLGLLKCGVAVTKKVLFVIFKIVTDPKGSYRYARQRVRDPVGTSEKLKKVFTDSWRMKKLKMLRSIGGSEKMTILSDTLQDTAIFQAFAAKGKTKKEKRRIQEQKKKRKWRIRKRDKEALYSCRHMLLHTLRKHPCLCVYHICPNFYPQCLSLLAFMKHFCDILLFLLALIVWTPCILCVEVARGMMCCLLCTH